MHSLVLYLAPVLKEPVNPCVPSPCGPNSQCREVHGSPVCSCLPGMKGFSPNCRPECTRNDDCLNHLSCINQKCSDPCSISPCGFNTECRVDKHNVICSCFTGYQSQDPTRGCTPIPITCKRIFISSSSSSFFGTFLKQFTSACSIVI